MLTGELRSQVDAIWNAFWSGGISAAASVRLPMPQPKSSTRPRKYGSAAVSNGLSWNSWSRICLANCASKNVILGSKVTGAYGLRHRLACVRYGESHGVRPVSGGHHAQPSSEDRTPQAQGASYRPRILRARVAPDSSGFERLIRHHEPVIRTPSLESSWMPEAIGRSGLTVGAAQPVSGSPRRTITKTARAYKIEMLIRNRGHVSFQALLDEPAVSPGRLKRDLDHLKDQFADPIEYNRFLNGYRFGQEYRGQKHQLPGLWFSEREIYSLLMAHQLLSELDSEGVINRHLQPLLDRIHQMPGTGEADATALLKRVKSFGCAQRPVSSRLFELIGEALLKRRRLHMRYLTRERGEVSERDVSPQRLVHYRNT